jgi:Amt family ammonium transporter
LIGTIAGVLVIVAFRFIESKGVDDPVGAIAVHGVNGTFGVLAVGIFADGQYGAGWNGTTTTTKGVVGLLYDGGQGAEQLIVQAISAVVIWTVMFGLVYGFFKISNRVMKGGIRAERDDELLGMDMPEMGAEAYPEFLHPERVSHLLEEPSNGSSTREDVHA